MSGNILRWKVNFFKSATLRKLAENIFWRKRIVWKRFVKGNILWQETFCSRKVLWRNRFEWKHFLAAEVCCGETFFLCFDFQSVDCIFNTFISFYRISNRRILFLGKLWKNKAFFNLLIFYCFVKVSKAP